MKTKLIILFLLMVSILQETSAITVVIIGGTKDNKFNYVRTTDNTITCKGNGNNTCPVGWYQAKNMVTGGTWHPLIDITNYVLKLVEGGRTNGDIMYENEIPVRWTLQDDKSVQMEISAEIRTNEDRK